MNQKSQISYPVQFIFLLLLVGAFMILSAMLLGVLGSSQLQISAAKVPEALNLPENAQFARWVNTLLSFIGFFLPALVFARLIHRKSPLSYLGFNEVMNTRQLLIVFFLTIAAMFFSGFLGELNQHIALPEKWMIQAREMEEAYKKTMLSMAVMKNFSEYLLALAIMAIAPAIFEETLFRGAFQQVFIGWTKSAWVGIAITSIIFSAIHFSYFGFLPRVALGMVLGFIFYYGKNLWLNILLHFLNNTFVVTQLYIAGRMGKPIEKTIDENAPLWTGIVGLIGVVILLKLFKKETRTILPARNTSFDNENIIS